MEINEIMNRHVVCLPSHSPVTDATDLMHRHNIRHIPVLDDGEAIGIVSDRDLRAYIGEIYRSATALQPRQTLTLRDVMQSNPIAVDPSADIAEVIDTMLDNKIGAVVVADSVGNLRGIVSYEDILKYVRDELA